MTPLLVQDLALISGVFIVAGFALLGSVALIPKTRALGLDMLRTFISATLIMAVLTGLFLLGPKALVPAFGLAALRIGFESASVRMPEGPAPLLFGILTSGLTIFATLDSRFALALLGGWFLLLARQLILPNASNPRTLRSILDLLVFPVLPLAVLAHGAVQPHLTALMLAAYILVEIFDSLALLCGKLFGRTKAFPTLSPNKTIGGLVGGGLSLMVLATLFAVALGVSAVSAALAALLVGLLAVAGDLAASRLKRIGGVKDFPIVFARQGGLLDSLDSWVAAGAGLTAVALLTTLV